MVPKKFESLVNSKTSDGYTLLHAAVVKENESAVKFLIELGADVNSKNSDWETPLELAFKCSDSKVKSVIIKTLVEAGADVNAKRKNGRTALHLAAENEDVELLKILLSLKVDLDAKDVYGWTALHWAAKHAASTAVFDLLLSAGADVNPKSDLGVTPLHVLSDYNFVPKSSGALNKIFQVFSNYKANFNELNNNGRTPLDVAIDTANADAVKALVDIGKVDVNQRFTPVRSKSNVGRSILHRACENVDLPSVKFLLKRDADVNALDDHNRSPLQYVINTIVANHRNLSSSFNKELELFVYLLKWNPDVNIVTSEGRNILSTDDKRDLPDYLWPCILQHLAKLKANASQIHSSLIDTIYSNNKYQVYFERCVGELENAKKTKVYPKMSSITYFDLLVNDKKILGQYVENFKSKEDFLDLRVIAKFPIYGALIHKRFMNAVESKNIWDEVEKELDDL